MKIFITFLIGILSAYSVSAQDLSEGLIVNDLSPHVMQDIAKPAYLETITDPSFGTTIRRITNALDNQVYKPMYSTIQAWNADESLMIIYNQTDGLHQLMDGMNYQFIRNLTDIVPADLEQIFWDFNDPDILYYPDQATKDLIKYNVSNQSKEVVVSLRDISGCDGFISMGNDVQMMSWDNDVITFRCENTTGYAYRISTGETTIFTINVLNWTAPNPAPSGNRFYHGQKVYNTSGQAIIQLNESNVEHSCIGKLPNGNDGHFAVSFAAGPSGGCLGNLIAHDLETGQCFPLISEDQGYQYSLSNTHISAVAHKNTEGGWIAASMMGYDQDGQSLLDQELVIVKAEEGNVKVCRIGHHRSDEDEFDYWGEPHPVISPSGTRVLFSSEWSGADDGKSVDCYVVELPTFTPTMTAVDVTVDKDDLTLYPNPTTGVFKIQGATASYNIKIYHGDGTLIQALQNTPSNIELDLSNLPSGLFFISIQSNIDDKIYRKKIIKY